MSHNETVVPNIGDGIAIAGQVTERMETTTQIMTEDEEQDTHICAKCKITFLNLNEYIMHKLSHDNCKVSYTKSKGSKVLMPKITQIEEKPPIPKPPVKGKKRGPKGPRKKPEVILESIPEYRCDRCPKSFRRKAALARHKEFDHHEEQDGRLKAEDDEEETHDSSDKDYKPNESIHIKTEPDTEPPKPKRARLEAKSDEDYDPEKESSENQFEAMNVGGVQILVRPPNKSLVQPALPADHYNVSLARPFQCTQCKRAFKDANVLKAHLLTHSDERDYPCWWDGCSYAFKTKGSLKRHMRRHTGERPFRCELCGRSFGESGALTRHLKSRTPCVNKADIDLPRYGQPVTFLRDIPAARGKTGELPSKDLAPAKPLVSSGAASSQDQATSQALPHKPTLIITQPPGITLSMEDLKMIEGATGERSLQDRIQMAEQQVVTDENGDEQIVLVIHSEENVPATQLFTCDVCTEKFDGKEALLEHLKIHMVIPQHRCSFCNHVANSENELLIHLRITHKVQKASVGDMETLSYSAPQVLKVIGEDGRLITTEPQLVLQQHNVLQAQNLLQEHNVHTTEQHYPDGTKVVVSQPQSMIVTEEELQAEEDVNENGEAANGAVVNMASSNNADDNQQQQQHQQELLEEHHPPEYSEEQPKYSEQQQLSEEQQELSEEQQEQSEEQQELSEEQQELSQEQEQQELSEEQQDLSERQQQLSQEQEQLSEQQQQEQQELSEEQHQSQELSEDDDQQPKIITFNEAGEQIITRLHGQMISIEDIADGQVIEEVDSFEEGAEVIATMETLIRNRRAQNQAIGEAIPDEVDQSSAGNNEVDDETNEKGEGEVEKEEKIEEVEEVETELATEKPEEDEVHDIKDMKQESDDTKEIEQEDEDHKQNEMTQEQTVEIDTSDIVFEESVGDKTDESSQDGTILYLDDANDESQLVVVNMEVVDEEERLIVQQATKTEKDYERIENVYIDENNVAVSYREYKEEGEVIEGMETEQQDETTMARQAAMPASETAAASLALKQTLALHDGPSSSKVGSKTVHHCRVCSRTFLSSHYLKLHQRSHVGERPHTCQLCRKTFMTRDSLIKHMVVHSSERNYKCGTCGKLFKRISHVREHLKVHMSDRPFSCLVCSKTFKSANSCKVHLRTHSAVLPFSCEFCQRSFRERGSLQRHLRTHTGEKPYSCRHCNRSFAEHGTLNRHLKAKVPCQGRGRNSDSTSTTAAAAGESSEDKPDTKPLLQAVGGSVGGGGGGGENTVLAEFSTVVADTQHYIVSEPQEVSMEGSQVLMLPGGEHPVTIQQQVIQPEHITQLQLQNPAHYTSEEYSAEQLQTEEYAAEQLQTEQYSEQLQAEEYSAEQLQTEEYSAEQLQTEEYSAEQLQTEEYSAEQLQTEEYSADQLQNEEYSEDQLLTDVGTLQPGQYTIINQTEETITLHNKKTGDTLQMPAHMVQSIAKK